MRRREGMAYEGVARMWVIVGELDLIESRGKWQAMKTLSNDRVTEGEKERAIERVCVFVEGVAYDCVIDFINKKAKAKTK